MGRGHSYDALRISFEHLSVEALWNGLSVADNQERSLDPFGSLPRIVNLNDGAGGILRADDLEAEGVCGCIKRFIEIGQFGTLAAQPANASASSNIKLRFFNILISLSVCSYIFFLFFPNFGVMPMKNSKLMPGIGRESTER